MEINDKFVKLSNSLHIAERNARSEIESRSKMTRIDPVRKSEKSEILRKLAEEARTELKRRDESYTIARKRMERQRLMLLKESSRESYEQLMNDQVFSFFNFSTIFDVHPEQKTRRSREEVGK